ncbi:hypothetical protein [Streptomyces sp. NBC_01431]|uniref:hypothetical protein n=1 Tax=Streptomyces sp. NBC_01431 TaxID=2903863 RepID=UPI002E313253|nr:hypothetical protein [Streptomyces sp. NBC_01431]
MDSTAWRVLADERLPGLRRLSPRHRVLYLTVAAVLVVGGLLLAYFTNYALDQSTAVDRARSDKNAQESLDGEQPAFVSTVTPRDYMQDMPRSIAVLLDRPLTASEQAGLKAKKGNAQVWAFLKPLGGRVVEYTTPPLKPLEDGRQNSIGMAQTFNLNLNSDRNAGLTINNMTAVKDACSAPTTPTVVDIPPAGSEPRQGLMWDLTGKQTDKPHGPYVLDEGESQGQLYFRRNAVDLGNGQSNMALRIQPEVSTQTCHWHIDASYTDTSGSHTQRIPRGTGTLTTEAIPKQPAQYFAWIPRTGWGCVGAASQEGCPGSESLRTAEPWRFEGQLD